MMLSIIVAADENNVIGGGNTLLWDLPADMKHFRSLTVGHTVIMGRKTYDSIIAHRGSPLPNRRNIVITRQDVDYFECEVVHSLNQALSLVKNEDEVFIIGGGEIYTQVLPYAHRVYLTRVHSAFEGGVYFPELSANKWQQVQSEFHESDDSNPYAYTFFVYEKKV